MQACGGSPIFPGSADTAIIGGFWVDLGADATVSSLTLGTGGTLNWTNGSLRFVDGASIGGSVLIGGTANRHLSGTITLSGDWSHTSSGGVYADSVVVYNQGLFSVSGGPWYYASGTNRIENDGTIRKTATSATTIDIPLVNRATLDVQAGSLYFLRGAQLDSGSIDIADGAILCLRGAQAGTVTADPVGALICDAGLGGGSGLTLHVEGTGLQWLGGNASGGITNATGSLLSVDAGNNRHVSGPLTNAGTIHQVNSGLYFDDSLVQNSGLIEIQNGFWSYSSGTNSISNSGTFRKTNASDVWIDLPLTNTGTVDVQAGSLSFYRGLQANGGTLDVASDATLILRGAQSGTMTGAPSGSIVVDQGLGGGSGLTLAVGGTGLRWAGGNAAGGVTNLDGSTLRIDSAANRHVGGPLVNAGTIQHLNSGLYFDDSVVQNSGLIQISDGFWSYSSGTNAMTNSGTIGKITDSSVWIDLPLTNSGAVDVQAGSLAFYRGLQASGGSFNVAADATLTLRGAQSGTFVASPAGTLVADQGLGGGTGMTLQIGGAGMHWTGGDCNGAITNAMNSLLLVEGSGNRHVHGAFVNDGTMRYLSPGGLYLDSSVITNNGQLEVSNGFWVLASGASMFENHGVLKKLTSSSVVLDLPISRMGDTRVHGGDLSIIRGGQGPGQITVDEGASLHLRGGWSGELSGSPVGSIICDSGLGQGSGLTLNLGGTGMQWTGGDCSGGVTNAAASLVTLSGPSNRHLSGSLANQGEMVFDTDSGLYVDGSSVSNAGTFEQRRGFWEWASGAPTFENNGTFRKTGSSDAWSALPFLNRGTLEVLGGTFTLTHGLDGAAGEVNVVSGATLTLRGTLSGTITGDGHGLVVCDQGVIAAASGVTLALRDSGLTWTGGNAQGPIVIAPSGRLVIAGAGGFHLTSSLSIQGSAIQTLTGGLWMDNAQVSNTGTIELQSGSWQWASGTNSLDNGGLIRKTTAAAVGINVNLLNHGEIEVAAGSLSFSRAFAQSAGAIHMTGGTLVSGQTMMLSGGLLDGSGIVQASVANSGATVSPGASAGVLNIQGAYSQAAGGILRIELGGPTQGSEHDLLAVSGAASLGGELRLAPINGFVPAVGQTFTIMTTGSTSGAFNPVTGPGRYSVSYNPHDVRVTVVLPPGDMDCDGSLGASDLASFLQALLDPSGYGAAHPGCFFLNADMNADGRVDGADIQPYVDSYFGH